MIVHIFNSSLVSGPETLVLPALSSMSAGIKVLLLRETRVAPAKIAKVETYLSDLNLDWLSMDIRARHDRVLIQQLADFLRTSSCQIAHAHDVKASYCLLRAAELVPNRSFSIVTTHHGVKARSGFLVNSTSSTTRCELQVSLIAFSQFAAKMPYACAHVE